MNRLAVHAGVPSEDTELPHNTEGFMYKLSALDPSAPYSHVPVCRSHSRFGNYDDKGAPPFKVLKEGENPPLDAYDNFVIGPKYVPAPERKKVEDVPEGKVQQFEIDSKETKLFNPGIAREGCSARSIRRTRRR